jgi:hypothetical protein
MNLLTKNWPRDAAIYFLKAFAFGLGSYLLMFVIYGGVRITLFAWIAIVLLAFALAYIPYLILRGRGKG